MANDKFISTSNLQSALKKYDNKVSTELEKKVDKTYVDEAIAANGVDENELNQMLDNILGQ